MTAVPLSDDSPRPRSERVRPIHRIVNAGQCWYLVAWDLDRQDWRTFRVDRIRPGISPGPRFSPRAVSDAEVGALIAKGIPVEARRHVAKVIVNAPATMLAERFGRWLGSATALDEGTSLITMGADRLEDLAVSLGYLNADFRMSEPPELVDLVGRLANRYAAASAAA